MGRCVEWRDSANDRIDAASGEQQLELIKAMKKATARQQERLVPFPVAVALVGLCEVEALYRATSAKEED